MNQPKDEELIFCIKCTENGRTGNQRGRIRKEELERSQWKNWICPKCADREIGLKLIDFIKTRISVTQTEDEDRSKFIFRELLQNADDVKSNILVLRFEEDALYVANDGRAFTTAPSGDNLSDFEMISQVLGRHKAEEKEVVGHFGSGFQTVYAITNSPEVHSSGRSGSMNPYSKEWDYTIEERKSPYLHRESKGVLFRFPWRDDKQAKKEINGVKVWEDRNYWPRWGKRERRKLFEDLREYIHQAILCCHHLKAIRLVWVEKDPPEGFQVVRNFCLRKSDIETLEMTFFKGSVKQGTIEPDDWKDKWNDSFQLEGWRWAQDSRSFDYLIGEKNASQDGRRVFIGKRHDGLVTVTPESGILEKELKRGDMFVIFPLFDVSSVFQHADGRAFLYSVIPLPGRGKNKFLFSAHFWPTEDRKDVNVEGPDGAYGKWYRRVMLNIVELYEWLFDKFLKQIHEVKMPEEVRQTIILNSVPGAPLSEWMRPGKESHTDWLRESQERFDKLVSSLIRKQILFSGGRWIEPTAAYWAQDDEGKAVFEIIGETTFTEDFMNHPHFKKTLSEMLRNREIDEGKFYNLWQEFVNANKNKSGNLVYCQNLKNGKTLDKRAVDSLIRFCITGSHATIGTLLRAVVPGRDGILRKLEEYPILPPQLEFLHDVLPGSKTIHDDFLSEKLALTHKKEVSVSNGDQIVFLIHEMVDKDPSRFKNMSESDHLALSRSLRVLVDEIGWAPRDGLKFCRFIPYREGTKVSVGTLNVRKEDGKWISHQNTGGHVERYYQRDSIFGVQTLKIPGLTPEIETRIRFLSLINCDDEAISKVENALDFEKLMAVKDTPMNFVWHFLSPRHGSLFVDSNLKSFLGLHDDERLVEQKKQFQEALKLYFKEEHRGESYLTREDMAKVPCLYDENGIWHEAGKFALALEPELKMLGYKSLHNNLRKWPRETLLALGVDYSPSCSKVIDAIKELAMEKEKHRKDLGNIVLWLLTSDVPIEAEFENLAHVSYVPTVDGGFKSPQHVLIPTSRNKTTLGDDYEGFLDCSFFRNKIDGDETWQKMAKRAESLGLKVEPELSDMLSVVRERRKAGKEPPVKLFDAVSKEVVSDKREAQDLISKENFGYYFNGRWMDSYQIRIIDENDVPKEIQGKLVILPASHLHSHYLMVDGASDKLLPEDILQPMLEKRVVPSLNVWDKLSKLASSIEQDHKKLYGGAPIYPVDESQVCPENIICIESNEDNVFLKEGAIGKRYILGRERTRTHGEVLKKLGARGGSELSRNDILNLIRAQKDEEATLSEDKVSLALRLIIRVKTLGSDVFPDEALWPAEKNGQIVWMKPRFCFVKDSPLSKCFEKYLSFICLKIDGKVESSLKDYAVASGCNAFSDHLKREGRIEIENCEEDSLGSCLYKELAKALSQCFSSLANSGCFEWLKNVEGRRCDKIAVGYSTGEFKTRVDRAALVEGDDSRWVISCDYQSPRIVRLNQLEEEIANTCIEQGFPDSEREKLQSIIYKLLTCKLGEWAYHVEDYKPTSSISEFTFEPVVEEPVPDHDAFQTLRDVLDLNRIEMNEVGYGDTKNTLQNWYQCCQICGSRTPSDEYGYTTSETLKRVMCSRGGRYKGETMGFSTDNSVLLCPTHQVLWVRGLVKFPALEESGEEVIRILQQRIDDFEKEASQNPQEEVSWECEVFEGKSKPGTGPVKGIWEKRKIKFRTEHLAGFLKTMREYLENKEKNFEV